MAYKKAGRTTRKRTTRRKTVRRARKTYPNKRTPKYVKSGSLTPSDVGRQLTVYKSPLSTITTNPKIPDGKASMSAGLRIQAVADITFDAAETTLHMVIFPGCNSGAFYLGGTDEATISKRHMLYTKHNQIKVAASSDPDTTLTEGEVVTGEQKWRLVSQAVKLTLVNNSDQNDGWWEAIRGNCNPKNFNIVTHATNQYIGNSDPAALNEFDPAAQIVENSTYASGKLRDIHRYLFQLHPQINEHNFKNLASIREQAINSDEKEFMMDDSFDCIYLRIHGRSGLSGTPTKLMAHLVANHEVVYDEDMPMARFHTETKRAAPGVLERCKDMLVRNNKAARVMYGGL